MAAQRKKNVSFSLTLPPRYGIFSTERICRCTGVFFCHFKFVCHSFFIPPQSAFQSSYNDAYSHNLAKMNHVVNDQVCFGPAILLQLNGGNEFFVLAIRYPQNEIHQLFSLSCSSQTDEGNCKMREEKKDVQDANRYWWQCIDENDINGVFIAAIPKQLQFTVRMSKPNPKFPTRLFWLLLSLLLVVVVRAVVNNIVWICTLRVDYSDSSS